jgi:hypothetical protein
MDREESFWEQEGTILLLCWQSQTCPVMNTNLDLSNKQTNKYNTIINRVIRKVRRLGGENGQFLHNRGMKRVTGNENFTK